MLQIIVIRFSPSFGETSFCCVSGRVRAARDKYPTINFFCFREKERGGGCETHDTDSDSASCTRHRVPQCPWANETSSRPHPSSAFLYRRRHELRPEIIDPESKAPAAATVESFKHLRRMTIRFQMLCGCNCHLAACRPPCPVV